MPQLTDVVDEVLRETRFDTGRDGVLTAAQMRSLWRDPTRQAYVRIATVVVPEAVLDVLAKELARELEAYVEPETQRIGTGLVGLKGGAMDSDEPTVAEFARTLVRAAAILGSARAVEILRGWVAGEPYRYSKRALLTGVRCERPLALEEGVRIEPLPTTLSWSELAPLLPETLGWHGYGFLENVGRAVLSVDGTAGPTLYRPKRADGGQPDRNLQEVWAGGGIPCLTTDMWQHRFTEALSLASDSCVLWTHSWRDFGDLSAFGFFGTTRELSIRSPLIAEAPLVQEHLEFARNLDVQRHSRPAESVDMAINRWVSSRHPNATLPDCFIDLRIALEALYLPQIRSELRFRLAVLGAWHLGADFQERRQYYDLLRRAYDYGSKAVHSGNVKDTPDSRETLADAQRACRKGILKRLAETEEPAWEAVDVALGAPTVKVES